ncbi:EAL domain-containing protein [Chromobacterium sp. IIBBL 290-4]|uniref:EAL domain-containing response regulator n=1 Tax=Chromobacterium sp. IIBBL 290-4 TaxID=2953890 RepID=UPI0020B8A7F5|nr:EAL domain-containing response regulator [Chromobacterium sp. IIBBL 290-4]UTH75051.1 EAL domain-containing response regulator [Chromobacterium sp. IIBBL 290-4]
MPMMDIQDILVVDDSRVQRRHAVELCQTLGAGSVREAEDGTQCLAMVRQQTPSLLLLDLEMPRQDGVQVMQQMAKLEMAVPIVVLSSKDYLLISTVELMGRELGLPVLGGLQKPLRREPLLDLLQRVWTPRQAQQALEHCPAQEVKAALENGQILPYYQPKVQLSDGRIKGAEMLARWHHPEHGVIGPGRFIPVIEQQGWATELTMLMLKQGLKQWQSWARQGLRLPLSVNLSALSLSGDELVDEIERYMSGSNVPARYIIFEVTETAIVDNLAHAIGCAVRLRLAGLGLSVDDFGTGFATLQQLTRFPFTELKIDQSLVTGISGKPHLIAVFNSIIEMARRLQLATVAEGIESPEDYQLVAERGCHLGQGFHIARPMPAADFLAWARQKPEPPAAATIKENLS